MPRTVFWTLLAMVVALGLMVGWLVDRPPAKPVEANEAFPRVSAQFHEAGKGPDAPKVLVQGKDRETGWEKRQALRDALDSAMESLKAKPCDPETRAAFLQAYVQRTNAQLRDDRNFGEDGAPFWRTSDDEAQTQGIRQLIQERFFSQDELGEALFRDALGDVGFKALQDQGRRQGAAYDGPEPDRCTNIGKPARVAGKRWREQTALK
jgi:hypothetical protein